MSSELSQSLVEPLEENTWKRRDKRYLRCHAGYFVRALCWSSVTATQRICASHDSNMKRVFLESNVFVNPWDLQDRLRLEPEKQ